MTDNVRVINPEEECKVIDVSALKENNRKLSCGLISPATEEVTDDITEDKTSEPIKRMEDIDRICKYLKDERRLSARHLSAFYRYFRPQVCRDRTHTSAADEPQPFVDEISG